jgi:hypothetical protein
VSDYTVSIDWGDGQSSAGTVVPNGAGGFDVKGSHTYAEEGTYTTAATVTDTPSSIVTATGSATVADAALSAKGASIGGTEGASTGTQTVATFTDADPNGTASDYTAIINWGDGQSSAGTVVPNGAGGFDVKGSHTYAEEGTYTTMATVTDAGGSIATATGSATIADAALSSTCAMSSSTAQSYLGPTATFIDQSSTGTASDFSALIGWGDGTSSPGTINGGPGTASYTVSGSHTYSSTGFFTVTTVINDVGGSSTTATCQVLVFAFAPGGGSFAIGDLENVTGKTVTFWGAQWWKVNPTSTPSTAASFKGFAEAPVSPSCGSAWTTDPGNSTPPPSGPLPDFMGVIVTDSYGQTGSAISGNTVHIVIVKTNPGYRPDPGHAGTGTVTQQAC